MSRKHHVTAVVPRLDPSLRMTDPFDCPRYARTGTSTIVRSLPSPIHLSMPRTNFRVRQRLQVRRSGIHGRGVYAREFIPAGTRLIEYRGERIPNEEGDRRYPWEEGVPHHTFLFMLDDDTVIDGARKGNIARWINHSCDPNCESITEDGHIYIDAIRDIEPGEEITFDYHLVTAERHTAKVKARYPCSCGAPNCRGTLLGKKR